MFALLGEHCVACQIQQSMNSKVGDGGVNSMAGDGGHPVPDGMGNKTRQRPYTLSLSL